MKASCLSVGLSDWNSLSVQCGLLWEVGLQPTQDWYEPKMRTHISGLAYRHYHDEFLFLILRKNHKKSGLLLFRDECELDLGLRFLGGQGFKVTRSKGKRLALKQSPTLGAHAHAHAHGFWVAMGAIWFSWVGMV